MAIILRWRDPAPCLSIADWRDAARRRLPGLARAFVEGGADDQVTRDATIAGERLALPIALTPTGCAGLSHWSGDVAAARAAEPNRDWLAREE